MGFHDREYARQSTADARRARRRLPWPPPATLTLMIIHGVAFAVVAVVQHDEGARALEMLALRGAVSHPAALLTYPLATVSIVRFVLTLSVLWIVGVRLERVAGALSLLILYFGGWLVAGAVYLAFAQLASELAAFPLDVPAGGIGAWVVALRRRDGGDVWVIRGRGVSATRALAIGAGLTAAGVFAWAGPPATGWVLAACAGSGAGLLCCPRPT